MTDRAPKMQVKCKVDNCSYNKQNMCYADKIEVDASGDKMANTSEGTCCNTFENRTE